MIASLMIARFRNSALFALVLTLLAMVGGCRSPATQVELFLDSDAPPTRAVRVRIRSFAGSIAPSDVPARAAAVGDVGETVLDTANPGMATLTLGGSLGILPSRTGDISPVTLWLRASVAASASTPEVLLDRVVRFSFARGQRGTVRVFLPLRCGDTAVGCTSVSAAACTVSVRCREQNATCGDQGECVNPEVIPVIAQDDAGGADSVPAPVDASTGRVDALSMDDIAVADATPTDAALDASSSDVPTRDDAGNDVPSADVGDANGSLPAGPGLIFPPSVSRISCRNPVFRWNAVPQATSYLVQACANRACSFGVSEFTSPTTTVMAPGLLSASRVVYWRVRGLMAGVPATEWSAVWEFQTPAVMGARCTFTGLLADYNGDGIGDLTIAAPGTAAPAVFLHYGRVGGPSGMPDLTIRRAANTFAARAAFAGDVNGDGFGDLLISAPQEDRLPMDRTGSFYLHFGGPTGVAAMAATVIFDTNPDEEFGSSIAGVGDVNADGYGDFVVGASRASRVAALAGAFFFFRGAPSLPFAAPVAFATAQANAQLGISVDAAGDVDSDGFADVIVAGVDPGVTGVHRGTGAGLEGTRIQLAASAASEPARVVAGIGDSDGDGYADVATGCPDGTASGAAYIQYGGSGAALFAAQAQLPSVMGSRMGASISLLGDLDADGRDDMLVGAPGRRAADVMLGTMVRLPRLQRSLVSAVAGAATTSRGVFDCNGDALPDVMLGNPSELDMLANPVGTVSLYYADAMGTIAAMPGQILRGAIRDARFGGWLAQLLSPCYGRYRATPRG